MKNRFVVASAAAIFAAAGMAQAQSFSESFDDITLLPGLGWAQQNNSNPIGVINYFQGNTAVFGPQATTGYLGTNFNNGAGLATISNWMMTPAVMLQNGQTFSFWARSVTASNYPDRLQVRMSLAGASTNCGALGNATAVGDFTTLLLDINPTYLTPANGGFPDVWTNYTVTVTGAAVPTLGRFAFRYFVENGGPAGANSDYIGIDEAVYTGVPQPTGACCLPNGTCTPGITAASCANQGGVFQGAASICSGQCPQPATGACCLPDGTCSTMTSIDCLAQNGLYGGNNVACGAANCAKAYPYGGQTIPIPDGTGNTQCGTDAIAEVTVADSFTISGIEASYHIAHTFQGDVTVSLEKVGGPTVVMVDRPGVPAATFGFGNDNYGAGPANAQRFISSDAGANIYDAPATPGVDNPKGRWKPENTLAPFVGLNSAGAWRLHAKDCAGADVGSVVAFTLLLKGGAAPVTCYANCDNSTLTPCLNVNDFTCFLNAFGANLPYANCDASTLVPVLNVNDFTCFLNAFGVGCGANNCSPH